MEQVLAVTFAAPAASAATIDLRFDLGTFASGSATVEAITPKGREFLAAVFGAGCVSITLPKSKAEDFARFAAQKGVGC